MFSMLFKPVTEVISEAERNALIDQLCETRGTQYKEMKKYRSL
jgi:hypothetical protein